MEEMDTLGSPIYTIDNIQTGKVYEIKIGNIYDLSKFWINIHFNELAIFNKYLTQFYTGEFKKPITISEIKTNLYCVIYKSKSYYRAIILPMILPHSNKVRVFLIDSGHIVNVCKDSIFHIDAKHKSISRFAYRACLANLKPSGNDCEWSQTDLQYFCNHVGEKRLLARVVNINCDHKLLFIEMFKILNGEAVSINLQLVKQQIANYSDIGNCQNESKVTRYSRKLKYQHLFPSFEPLERGIVPCSIWEKKLIIDNIPLDVLYKYYYKYQSINSEV